MNKKRQKQIKDEVKRYNDRIRYYRKKGYNVPQTTSYSEIAAFYGDNTAALNRRLRQLKDYTYKNAKEKIKVGKYNVNVNKYDYEKFNENAPFAIGSLSEQIRLAKIRDRRNGYGLPSEYTQELIARQKTIKQGLSNKATKAQLNAAMQQASYYTENRMRTNEQFYQNFLDMYKEQMQMVKVPKSVQQKIENNFRKLSPEELLDLYESEPDIKNVLMWYKVTKATGGKNLSHIVQQDGESTAETMQAYLSGERLTPAQLEREKFKDMADALPSLVKKYQVGNYDKPNTKYIKYFKRLLK